MSIYSPPTSFDFATGRIIFGWSSIGRLGELVRPLGARPLLVTGSHPERFPLSASLAHATFIVPGEPTLDLVRAGAKVAREQCDSVIAVGGGSAIDAAKAIAALAPNSGEPLDYLEVIGKGGQLQVPSLPVIAVPTTAGTGAEVTRNAVLGSPEHGLKASLRGQYLQPALALIDPELTLSLSPEATATTGLDAVTQLLEAFVSSRANSFTDAFCREGLERAAGALREAYRNGSNRAAREQMSYASLLSGLALANAGLGVVHGFAAPLGGLLAASHGSICAAVLTAGTAVNIRALQSRSADHPALKKYDEAAMLLTGANDANHKILLDWLRALVEDLQIRPLGALGLKQEQISELVEKAANANSMKANPIQLTAEELDEIARRSF